MVMRPDLPPSTPESAEHARLIAELEREEIRRETGIEINADGLTPRSAKFAREQREKQPERVEDAPAQNDTTAGARTPNRNV